MKNLDFSRCALGLSVSLAMLAGCVAPQSPVGAPGAMPQIRAIASHAKHSQSWMLPEARNQDLLYVSDWRAGDVYVYSYPRGKLVGMLSGFSLPSGLCVDKVGDIWVTSQEVGDIVEYAHGGVSPINTLNNGSIGMGCAVDPMTGNLAATSLEGGITIWQNAQGTPTHYWPPHLVQTYFCTYDNKGNLYADGLYSLNTYRVGVDELLKGSSKFKRVALPVHINAPGGVQWDGKYVAIEDVNVTIYQFTIADSIATLSGTTKLIGTATVWQIWIQGSKVIGPNNNNGEVKFWNYPAGGVATKTITGLAQPDGVAVSHAPQ